MSSKYGLVFGLRVGTLLCSLFAVGVLTSPARAQAPGYWHTSGNQILDSAGNPVRIAGVNWYGFEGSHGVVQGLWAQDYRVILNTIKRSGYNTIRLPFSNQMAEGLVYPDHLSYSNSSGSINTDLQGLNSLSIMDKIVAYAGQIGLYIILDNHRSEAGSGTETGLWYTTSYSEQAWLKDWQDLARRYLNDPTVIGVDLRNEPHDADKFGSCWGCGIAVFDWQQAAQRGGNAVLSVNPNLLIFVEGTDAYKGDYNWWGGNLEGALDHPVILSLPNRLVYSVHEYGPHLYTQAWFNGSTTYDSLATRYTKMWGYLSQWGIAPVWVGEFGTTNTNVEILNDAPGSQGQWFRSLVTYLHDNPAMGWTYWALDGEDIYGLLDANYDSAPANPLKQQLLTTIQSPVARTPLRFVSVNPCRIADTREAVGRFGGPFLKGGTIREFAVPSSACGIPTNAQAYSLNVTVVPDESLSYLTIWPAGQAQPTVSTLNSYDGRTKADAAIVPAGTGGAVDVFVTGRTHVILDINGYFVRSSENPALAFYPLAPCRVADTRQETGPLGAPYLSASQSRDFPVLLSPCGIPTNAQAYSLNFTAVPRGPLAYLTTWPAGQAQPTVSTLNATTGETTANAAIVPSGRNGDISVFARNDTDLVIDVNGYFAPPSTDGLSLYNVRPCRASDTRDGPGSLGMSGTATVQVLGGPCDVGANAQAYVMNATVVPQSVNGGAEKLQYLTLYPNGQLRPFVSTLNSMDGSVVSNMAIVPAGKLGFIDSYATERTHLITDIFGYFAP